MNVPWQPKKTMGRAFQHREAYRLMAFDAATAKAVPYSGVLLASASRPYRADIDGLRAIAVLAVIAFHLGVPWVRGGYVGVDIFFVISGFLITGIIAEEIEAGKFSLSDFYIRRIRRIVPALAVVLASCAMASAALQFPTETIDFGKSLIAAVVFSSNVFFLSKAQYFGGASETMPLLHTWSLAVEEQFYLVFPLILMWLAHRGRDAWSWIVPMISAVALVSFIISAVMVYVHQEWAFYLIFSRGWELAAGALIALGAFPRLRNRMLAEVIGLAGLLLIVLAVIFYHKALHFPGVLALAPVGGAAALIYSGTVTGTVVGRLLACRPLVFIGLISYSLYLWHWPIIAFWHSFAGHRPGLAGMAVLFMLCLLVSYLSWRFVELPMRRAGSPVARHPWSSLAVVALTATIFGAASLASGGWPARFTPAQVATAAYLGYDDAAIYRRGTCFIDSHVQGAAAFDRPACLALSTGKPNILLLGDSHAAHLWRAFSDSFPGLNILQATASGCKPVRHGRGEAPCRQIVDGMMTGFIPRTRPDAIILAARWEPDDLAAIQETLTALAPYTKKIYVFGPIVTYDSGLPRLLAQSETRGPAIIENSRLTEAMEADSVLAAALGGGPSQYVSLYQTLCPAPAPCATRAADGSPLQWDYGHLTYQGGLFLASALRSQGLFP